MTALAGEPMTPLLPFGRPLYAAETPQPISTNNLFASSGRRRVRTKAYRAWCGQAEAMMLAQGPRPALMGPVWVAISIGAKGLSPRLDLDNCAKAYLDALVSMGVIPDDNNQTVRAVLVTLRPNEVGAVLTVLEYEGLK